MADILDMLEEAEWTAAQGRGAQASPYLPAVQKSWDARPEGSKMGKAFSFTVTLNGKSQEEQDKDLARNENQLRRCGRQVSNGPCSVLVQHGDVNRKTGEVRITFTTREKITRTQTPAAA